MSKKREKAVKAFHRLSKKGIHLMDVDPTLFMYIGCPKGKKCSGCSYGIFDQNPVHVDRRESKLRIKREIQD